MRYCVTCGREVGEPPQEILDAEDRGALTAPICRECYIAEWAEPDEADFMREQDRAGHA